MAGAVAPGYVPVVDGSVKSYVYGTYINNLSNSTWSEATYTFTLDAETTICLL